MEFLWFYKLWCFENLLFFEILQFQKIDDVRNRKIWENFWNFINSKFLESSKLEIFGIFQIRIKKNSNIKFLKFS